MTVQCSSYGARENHQEKDRSGNGTFNVHLTIHKEI